MRSLTHQPTRMYPKQAGQCASILIAQNDLLVRDSNDTLPRVPKSNLRHLSVLLPLATNNVYAYYCSCKAKLFPILDQSGFARHDLSRAHTHTLSLSLFFSTVQHRPRKTPLTQPVRPAAELTHLGSGFTYLVSSSPLYI